MLSTLSARLRPAQSVPRHCSWYRQPTFRTRLLGRNHIYPVSMQLCFFGHLGLYYTRKLFPNYTGLKYVRRKLPDFRRFRHLDKGCLSQSALGFHSHLFLICFSAWHLQRPPHSTGVWGRDCCKPEAILDFIVSSKLTCVTVWGPVSNTNKTK